jgi:hypothetical protein
MAVNVLTCIDWKLGAVLYLKNSYLLQILRVIFTGSRGGGREIDFLLTFLYVFLSNDEFFSWRNSEGYFS